MFIIELKRSLLPKYTSPRSPAFTKICIRKRSPKPPLPGLNGRGVNK